MRRREFIALVAITGWSCAARAQQKEQTIGFLSSVSPGPWAPLVGAFRRGLNETGFIEGQNVTIEFRWAEGLYDALPAMADDLVRRGVDVIVATGGGPAALAAQKATAAAGTPVVFSGASDPVKLGLVKSMNRPGGNLTGTHLFVIGLEPKRLELLRELVPNTALIAVLVNPKNPEADSQVAFIRDAAVAVGQSIQLLKASTEGEIQAAFAALVQQRAGAVLVGADPFFNSQRQQLIELAARHGIPASYELREFAVDGGLMSYGNNLADAYRQVGIYAGRILKGEKPGDLPVVQPIKFELVINLKTARALGIDVSPTLLARADEVIE